MSEAGRPPYPMTIAYAHQKGGTGKSMCAHFTIMEALRRGKRVLALDGDMQMSLSYLLWTDHYDQYARKRMNNESIDHDLDRNMASALMNKMLGPHIVEISPQLDLVPASLDLREIQNLSHLAVANTLTNFYSRNTDVTYDLIVIDLPGTWNAIVKSAFYAADFVVSPSTLNDTPTFLALEGFQKLLREEAPGGMRKWKVLFNEVGDSHAHDRYRNYFSTEYNTLETELPRSAKYHNAKEERRHLSPTGDQYEVRAFDRIVRLYDEITTEAQRHFEKRISTHEGD